MTVDHADRLLAAQLLNLTLSLHVFFFSSRRRHTSCGRDWSSDVCSSDLVFQRSASAGKPMWPPHGSGRCSWSTKHRRWPEVLGELRILSSADFDATSLLTVVLSGDGRLLELLRQEDLVPLGTRIRTRLVTEAASREELLELLRHALSKAGNATLMTAELMDALVDHSAGNYRLLMIMGAELLAYGMAHDVAQLDEKCYLEVFQPRHSRPALKKKVKV